MEFEIIAELLLGLLANGIRFYADKRYIDFFVSKEKCRWKNIWILYIITSFLTFTVNIVLASPAWNITVNIMALLLLTLPYQVSVTKKCLIVFTVYGINALVDVIVVQLLTKYVQGHSVRAVYHLIIGLVILIPTAFFKESKKTEKDVSLPFINIFILCMIPLISVVCMYRIIVLKGADKTIALTVAFSLIVINVFLFYLYHILTKFYVAQMNEKKLEKMVDVYANQLDVMQESQEYVKKLRHDMKHHLIELSSMAQHDKNEDMVRYLKQMEKFMLNPAEKVSTGNKEIDGVLNYMLRQADELLDTVDLDIQIPKQLYSKNFNICVILGNLVDNAVREASKSDEKYLSVSVHTQKDILLILIENSYTGTITKRGNKLQTSQIHSSIHGIGLESVRQVVNSCGGDMKIEYTEKCFQVQVFLYLSSI